MTQRTKRLVAAGIAALGLLTAVGAMMFTRGRPPQQTGLSPFNVVRDARSAVPVLFESPPFDFVDQDGRRTQDSGLHGRIWIADFIFTHCAGSCPKVTAKFVELQNAINDPDVRFVSFSVDPERDDPHTLKEYGAAHNVAEQRWLLLHPPNPEAILQVARRMMAIAGSSMTSDTILHTDFFTLVDHNGHVRGLYDSKDPGAVERLKADFAKVARQRLFDLNLPAGQVQPRAD